jgi:hypothetical protein
MDVMNVRESLDLERSWISPSDVAVILEDFSTKKGSNRSQ